MIKSQNKVTNDYVYTNADLTKLKTEMET